MNIIQNMKIRTFLILFIIFFIFAPSLLSVFFAYSFTKRTVSNDYSKSYMYSTFEEIESSIYASTLQLTEYTMQFLGYRNSKKATYDSNPENQELFIREFFENIIEESNIIESIDYIYPDGKTINIKKDNENLTIHDDKFFSDMTKNHFKISYIIDEDKVYYAFAKQIYSFENNSHLGDVVFYLNEGFFKEFTSSAISPEITFFISYDGKIISHPNTEYIGSKLYIPEEVLSNESGIYSKSQYSYATHIIKNNSIEKDLQITGIVSNQALFSTMNDVVIYLVILLLVSVTFAIILAVLLSKKLTYKIEKLKSNMADYMQNHESYNPIIPSNEIGSLEISFNNLTEEITNLLHNLAKEKEKQIDYEIRALQSQINPHFIYNVLDSISWKAKENHQYEIDDMVITLAKFFRIGLHKGDNIITVSDEIEHVKSYLKIEKIRFPELFEATFNIDNDILDKKIIKLILQPLVENSIKHGFSNIKNKPGHIVINGYKKDDSLYFEVIDDGCGMNFDDALSYSSKGYGIKNVHRRIRLQYGDEYGITYSPNPDGQGTKATIRIKDNIE